MKRALPLLASLLLLLAACAEDAGEGTAATATTAAAASTATVSLTDGAPASPAAPPTSTPVSAETRPPADTPTAPADTPTSPAPGPVDSISLAPVAEGFEQPVHVTHAGDERLFVVEQAGRIMIVEDGRPRQPAFLDIQPQVGSSGNEQGLLSVAFHPGYGQNGYFYVNYTDRDGDTVVARFQVSAADPNLADPDSESVVLQVDQPYPNHNGGHVLFGPDGYLYVALGDGGSGGDPHGHGQNPETLLGSILRLAVDSVEPYGIPRDNPFVGVNPAGRGEIWAIGLRNPWRLAFDRLTGDLYIADVGQGSWEEVNFQPAGSAGGENYGWNIMEGNRCFGRQNCSADGLVLPVAEYGHDQGCSVTGGAVYRGAQFPSLYGTYFFGDYCSGIIWSLARDDDGRWVQRLLANTDYLISSFGEDAAGELYLTDRSSGALLQVQP